MSEEKQDEKEMIFLVYVGSRIGRGDKLIDLWMVVTAAEYGDASAPPPDERSECYRAYDGKAKAIKKYMMGCPGSVYEVPQVKGDTRLYSDQARYRGLWPDEAHRLKWQVLHREARTTADLWKQAQKEGAGDNFSALKPVRERYGKLIGQDRKAALLAQIIAYITGG